MAKFPWGDQAFVMSSAFFGLFLGVAVVGAVLLMCGPDGATDNIFPSVLELQPLALASAVWVVMWYTLLGNQIGVKMVAKEHDAEAVKQAIHIADRGVINTLEQSIPFLMLVWLHAIFVNPRTSAALAWVFVACRFLYPITYGMYGQMNSVVELPQWTCYAEVFYLLIALIYKVGKGQDLHTDANSISPALVFGPIFAAQVCTLLAFTLLAKPAVTVIYKGVEWDQDYVAGDSSPEDGDASRGLMGQE
jgi:hypothetical protein